MRKKTARKKSTRKLVKVGPLSALGWNRAFFNPKTGKELKGAWVNPNPPALQHAAQRAVNDSQKRVFRDNQLGLKSARKVGLV